MIRDEQPGSSLVDDVYHALQAHGGQVFALTAAAQNCGVANCATELARRYAESGSNVLVVDFNLLEPKVHLECGVDQAEWWPGDRAANDAIQSVAPHLYVLASPDVGGAHISFHERMTLKLALVEWRQRFDRIFVCSPPLLDDDPDQMPADILCSLTDGTVLLVRGGSSTVPQIQEMSRRLDRAGAALIGAVLNDRDNPPVQFELYDRLQKFEHFAPRTIGLVRKLIGKSLILNAYR